MPSIRIIPFVRAKAASHLTCQSLVVLRALRREGIQWCKDTELQLFKRDNNCNFQVNGEMWDGTTANLNFAWFSASEAEGNGDRQARTWQPRTESVYSSAIPQHTTVVKVFLLISVNTSSGCSLCSAIMMTKSTPGQFFSPSVNMHCGGVGVLMEVQAAASDNKLLCFPQRTMCLPIGRMSCKHLFFFYLWVMDNDDIWFPQSHFRTMSVFWNWLRAQ